MSNTSEETRLRRMSSIPLRAEIRDRDVEFNGMDDGLLPEGGVDAGVDPGLSGGNGRGPSGRPPGRERFPVHTPKVNTPLDVNLYATKKTVAQGIMDLALLTANANQLRYVLESGSAGGLYYNINVTLICMSIFLQIFIGIALIFLGRYNVSLEEQAIKADHLNNWIVLGVFLISVVNVFISAFGIEPLDGLNPEMVRQAVKSAAEMNPGNVLG